MGKIELDFLEVIFEEYPELKQLEVRLYDTQIEFDSPNYLLPYLSIVNSLDEKNRLINIFHPPYSEHYKIIPFYIALAVFKKEIIKMKGELQPINDKIRVINNGSICTLKNLDLEKERIGIKTGSYSGYISFDEFLSPLIHPYESSKKSFNEFKKLIRKYQLTNTESIRGLFDIPEFVESGYKSGVIIFSNKKKFQSLFKGLNISGVDISKKLPAVEAVYDSKKNKYKYHSLNNSQTTDSSTPFILLASYLDIERIKDFRLAYPYLDTIIFDDAESRLSDIEKVNKSLISSLESDEEGSLRDAYLLTADSEIYNFYEIRKWNSTISHHWITTEKDMSDYDGHKQNIHVTNESNYSELLSKLNDLRKDVASLYKSYNYSIISPIYEGIREIGKRFISIYEPVSFNEYLLKYKKEFVEFSESYLDDDYHGKLIDDFFKVIDSMASISQKDKMQLLKQIIDNEDAPKNGLDSVAVVCRNKNKEDQNFISAFFRSQGINVEFETFESNIGDLRGRGFDKIIFLEIRKPYISSLFIHDYLTDIHLILSGYEFMYYQKAFKHTTQIINSFTNHKARGKLLNLADIYVTAYIEKAWMYSTDIRDYVSNLEEFNERNQDQLQQIGNEELDDNMLIFDEADNEIEKILLEKFNGSSRFKTNEEEYSSKVGQKEFLLIFDDGSRVKTYQNKSFYKVIDDNISSINDLKVKANSINPGDELFIFDIQSEDLLELLISTIRNSKHFKEIFELSEVWRDNLKKLCDEVGFDRATELISEYVDRSVITLKHWYYGDTFAPQQHEEIIRALNKIAKSTDISGVKNMQSVGKIKDASSSIKGLLLRIPRLLKDGFIRQFYNLNEVRTDVNQSESELIDIILKEVEIKTVRHLLEINNN